MKKITKRDIFFFFLGIFAMIIIDSVWDWDNSVKSFKAGLYGYQPKAEKEQVK